MRTTIASLLVLFLLVFSTAASAITIDPIYDLMIPGRPTTPFPDADKLIIEEAIREWTCLFLCGTTIFIAFLRQDNLSTVEPDTLGETFGNASKTGRATIFIDYDDHNWTLGPPEPDRFDALHTLKHEIGHALGLKHEDALDSGDLMFNFSKPGRRLHPTPLHAELLSFLYDYTVNPDPSLHVTPEPSTLLLLGSSLVGLGGFAWRRRRRE